MGNDIIKHIGNCLDILPTLPEQSIDCCVTSPPYWGLRDYGMEDQLGLDLSPEKYIENMVQVFREVWRVLKDDGTLWLNLGDSYANNGTGGHGATGRKVPDGLKIKDLVGIPWRVALALQADGWYLRSDIIWSKPNPMPESVTDRPTKSHEYIFLLSKSAKYYYDHQAIREQAEHSSIKRWEQDIENQKGSERVPGKANGNMKAVGGPKKDKQRGYSRRHAGFNDRWDKMTTAEQCSLGRNKRSVWNIATMPYKGAHFATFPPKLIEPCILAGCPEGGTVLDPFGGSGTTAMVAVKHRRKAVLIELNPEYEKLQDKRTTEVQIEAF